MAEFIGIEEKVIDIDEPVIFENKTDSDFEVSAGIVFRKSGLYDVSIVGRRTIVSKVAESKIIRCRDCKHWGKRGLCDKWDYYISNYDFYCGCAERRK